jgi:DNA-directed RNA polymerase specialized sigma24 family protein
MINHIHDRLVTWASAALSDTLGALSYSSILLEMEDTSERNNDTVALWSPAVEEIERAVNSLAYELRETIKAIYLEPEAKMSQAAKRCGCSVATLRRRRNKAHEKIEAFLNENKPTKKVFLSTLKNSSCKRERLVENAF